MPCGEPVGGSSGLRVTSGRRVGGEMFGAQDRRPPLTCTRTRPDMVNYTGEQMRSFEQPHDPPEQDYDEYDNFGKERLDALAGEDPSRHDQHALRAIIAVIVDMSRPLGAFPRRPVFREGFDAGCDRIGPYVLIDIEGRAHVFHSKLFEGTYHALRHGLGAARSAEDESWTRPIPKNASPKNRPGVATGGEKLRRSLG